MHNQHAPVQEYKCSIQQQVGQTNSNRRQTSRKPRMECIKRSTLNLHRQPKVQFLRDDSSTATAHPFLLCLRLLSSSTSNIL
jgi:hypothetical protein